MTSAPKTAHRSRLLLLALVLAFGCETASAHEKVWVGLFLGRNGLPAPGAELAPPPLAFSLHEVFGFNTYSLVKSEEIELRHEWDQWVIPRNDWFIRVKPLPRHNGEPRLIDYELYKDGFIVARGNWQPSEGTPLFITGPAYREGRLIFVLEPR